MARHHLRIIWIVYWVALFVVMHTPKPDRVRLPASHLDKVIHFGVYAVLAALCAMVAGHGGRKLTFKWYFAWTLIFASYAAADELLQPLVNRSASLWDWLADLAGVIVAFAVIAWRSRRRQIHVDA